MGNTAMNERDIRAYKNLCEEAIEDGASQIHVMPMADIDTHPQREEINRALFELFVSDKRRCLKCNKPFSQRLGEGPSHIFFASALRTGPKHSMIAGICFDCSQGDDLGQFVLDAAQKIFPGCKCNSILPAPERRQ
jgi:hypothetical protein